MSLENYEKKAVIGKGKYGEVWLARKKFEKKLYVLKKMDLRNASKRERLAAELEARLLFDLKHPNIVAYKDSFEADSGFLYIVVGYCEGGDLYTRLKQQNSVPLNERQIVEWFVQIAMALQYMHERKILHRNLKTQNIFLTKNKIIKVCGLGCARVLESSSDMATTLIGTPYYMSPELFSNKPYSFKADVWALGCCAYEMITLKQAFNGKDMDSLMYEVLHGKMPSMPDTYRVELINLIKAMLNRNPEERPSVGRILRDPYVKENIAIFLEDTKKRGQHSDSRTRTSSGGKKIESTGSICQMADSAISGGSNQSSNQQQPCQVRNRSDKVEESLEPLHIGSDLEPIREEPASHESLAADDVSSKHRSKKRVRFSNQMPSRQRSQSNGDLPAPNAAYADYDGQEIKEKEALIVM